VAVIVVACEGFCCFVVVVKKKRKRKRKMMGVRKRMKKRKKRKKRRRKRRKRRRREHDRQGRVAVGLRPVASDGFVCASCLHKEIRRNKQKKQNKK
jgi:hypothetical protein